MVKPKSGTTGPKRTKPKPVEENCKTCKYSKRDAAYCYRYPKPELVAPTHWCGEWNKLS